MSEIFVIGHKNPDNDSIMAAYTAAHLLNMIDPNNEYAPKRLGPLPAESKMIFDEYGIKEAPELIESVGEGDRVVLVDHNELGQAVDGLENAEVVGVIDHHRIADLSTAAPIYFLNLPLGSTTSIIKGLFDMNEIDIEPAIAACLVSAILTDTVIMKSPTCTDKDRDRVAELCQILGVDPVEFGMKIFKSRGGDDDVSVEDICSRDSKEFNFGGRKVWVAQYETVDLEGMKGRIPEITAQVQKIQQDGSYDAALMLLTDIIVEGSEFLAAGDVAFIEGAFDISFANGSVWMPGVLSRKKQVAAVLVDYAG